MGKPDKEEDLLVDEEEVEEELEHLEEQKKRREKKLKERHRKQRRVIITIALLAAIAVAVVFAIRAQKAKEAAADATVSIETAEDEELIYAKVTSIKGNDMDVSILKAAEAGTDAGTDAGKGAASDGTHAGPPSDGTQAAPATSDGTQAAPAAGGSQTPPSFGQNAASSETQYTETGETKSYEIPVGTEVITKTGTETTFARLSVDNTLAIVVKKDTDNIIRIYIQ